MKKIGLNSICPCSSGIKYKKCCLPYHKGALPKSALELMRSRYSAYAVNKSNYIIKTTHPNHLEYSENLREWKESIESFSTHTKFLSLEILDFVSFENEAFVTFKAILSSGEMLEKSRFLRVNKIWLYESGEIDLD